MSASASSVRGFLPSISAIWKTTGLQQMLGDISTATKRAAPLALHFVSAQLRFEQFQRSLRHPRILSTVTSCSPYANAASDVSSSTGCPSEEAAINLAGSSTEHRKPEPCLGISTSSAGSCAAVENSCHALLVYTRSSSSELDSRFVDRAVVVVVVVVGAVASRPCFRLTAQHSSAATLPPPTTCALPYDVA